MKMTHSMGKKYWLSIANIYQVLSILDKLLVSRIYKEFWQQNNKKTNNLIF